MKTYLTVFFSSEGPAPSNIVERLQRLGFAPTQGNYDFVYEWDKNANLEDQIWFADKVRTALEGTSVFFNTETV